VGKKRKLVTNFRGFLAKKGAERAGYCGKTANVQGTQNLLKPIILKT